MRIVRYDIELDYDEKTKNYNGKEKIVLDGDEETFKINTLNHEFIKIVLNGNPIGMEDGKKEDEKILRGKLMQNSVLEIEFNGKVPEALTGMYLARAQDGSEMVSTQFESIGARRAFPCFDEPLLKAQFNITLKIAEGLDAIGNMPISKIEVESGRKKVVFETTPRMPTYLLYIGVGKFKTIERKHGKLGIYLSGLENNMHTTEFPLDVAGKVVDFFNEYTGIEYMLPKMHLISVPEFAAGAMENWGAITFRESALLINESSGGSSRKRVASVIAHEIAHMWFGDLVTMKYWNDLWLNESFATFMANKAIEHLFPQWNITGDMLLSDSRGAFLVDSLESSNPVAPSEKDMDKMGERSTEITYGKGGMILRMIETYAGEDAFRKGLHNYLKRFSYDNAEGEDLWRAIAVSSGKPVDTIMKEWIGRMGYPVIKVNSGAKSYVEQERFMLNGKKTEEIWPVPLTVKGR